MLSLYTSINDFESFATNLHEQLYKEKIDYDKLQTDFDVLILDKEKYTVDDIQDYIGFYKYKPIQKNKKLSIVNNFDLIDIKLQNKLLKLFEENKENHIIIANNVNKILPTIKSRATLHSGDEIKKNNFEKYPKRYWDVLKVFENNIDENEIDFYLKIFDALVAGNYKQAYIKLSVLQDYNEQIIYEIFQYTHKSIGDMEVLLQLQQRLFTRTNKKLQIENYLLQRIKSNGSN